MANKSSPVASRDSRREKLKKINEQVVAMNECEDLQETEEDGCYLAEELNAIKDRIRKRSNEAILATGTKRYS
jgi:hypothetical protein